MRRKDREITQLPQILAIVEQAKYLHLSLFDEIYPYIVPLHYGWEYREDRLVFYMHAAREGHKLDLIYKNPNACVQLECNVSPAPGGDIPCHYGSYYASLIARGHTRLLTDGEEKCRALQLFMKHQTGREFTFTQEMADTVSVICFETLDFSAKARQKPQLFPASVGTA